MIDLHTHILPNIDDGPPTLAKSLSLLQTEFEDDVEEIVFTPHYYFQRQTIDDFLLARAKAYKSIALFSPPELKPLINRSRLGAETYLTPSMINNPDIVRLGIAGTDKILIELPYFSKPEKSIADKFYALNCNTGLIPIIAHIERYPSIYNDYDFMQSLSESSCLFQMNADTIVNEPLKKIGYKLLKSGYISYIGSDCHNKTTRPPMMKKAKKAMINELGADFASNFFSIPI